jgi:hypothetical protein
MRASDLHEGKVYPSVHEWNAMTDFLTEMNQGPLVVPHQIERTGIRRGLLEDLALKILYLNGEMTLVQLSDPLCLSLGMVEEIFQFLRKERLCEVKGMSGGTHRIATSLEGQQKASVLSGIGKITMRQVGRETEDYSWK